MKKGNIRTIKKYMPDGTKFAVEVKMRGHWRQAYTSKLKKPCLYDLEYDACAKLLSAFEIDHKIALK